jgi:hypothetical protein
MVAAPTTACARDDDARKTARILAADDRRLTDLVAAWVGKPGVAQTKAERTLADVVHAFEIVGDAGLASFLDVPTEAPSPERARDALNAVGLTLHAKVFSDLLAARGPQGVPHATLLALEDRFRALPDPAPTLARFIRAHAAELRLAKIRERSIPE